MWAQGIWEVFPKGSAEGSPLSCSLWLLLLSKARSPPWVGPGAVGIDPSQNPMMFHRGVFGRLLV